LLERVRFYPQTGRLSSKPIRRYDLGL